MTEYSILVYDSNQIISDGGSVDWGSGGAFGVGGGITTGSTVTPLKIVVEDDDDSMDELDGDATQGTVVSVDGDTSHALVGQEISLAVSTTDDSADFTVANDDGSGDLTGVALQASIGGDTDYFVTREVLEPDTTLLDAFAGTIINGAGEGPINYSDIAICFTAGMRIETDKGAVACEDLEVGDLVKTFDNGLQPVRFIYRRKMASAGKHRAVVFEKGSLGNNERFVVSQRHRIHTSMVPELKTTKFKDSLIEARELVNGSTVKLDTTSKEVEYFHIMFDNHELIWSEGVLSESWQPAQRNLKRDANLREELLSIFPEIRTKKVNPRPARETITMNNHQA